MAAFTSLDAIVRNVILRKRLSLHWYIDFMVHAVNCLRELSMDDLKCVNTKLLTVDAYNAIDLPNDYLDYTRVGIKAGQNIKPLVETDKINSLVNRNPADLSPTTYGNANADNSTAALYYGYSYPFFWHTVTWNQYGESVGRMFGFGAGIQDDVFKVVKERNQIQLTENLSVSEIVLEYISDGTSADAATAVTPYAYATIAAYIDWQIKENSRSYGMGDRQLAKSEYVSQRQILRARLSDLTPEVLERIIQKNSFGSAR